MYVPMPAAGFAFWLLASNMRRRTPLAIFAGGPRRVRPRHWMGYPVMPARLAARRAAVVALLAASACFVGCDRVEKRVEKALEPRPPTDEQRRALADAIAGAADGQRSREPGGAGGERASRIGNATLRVGACDELTIGKRAAEISDGWVIPGRAASLRADAAHFCDLRFEGGLAVACGATARPTQPPEAVERRGGDLRFCLGPGGTIAFVSVWNDRTAEAVVVEAFGEPWVYPTGGATVLRVMIPVPEGEVSGKLEVLVRSLGSAEAVLGERTISAYVAG